MRLRDELNMSATTITKNEADKKALKLHITNKTDEAEFAKSILLITGKIDELNKNVVKLATNANSQKMSSYDAAGWAPLISQLSKRTFVFAAQPVLEKIQSSRALSVDFVGLVASGVFTTTSLASGSVKEFNSAVKNMEAAPAGFGLFFLEYDLDCTTGDSELDKHEIERLKKFMERLSSLTSGMFEQLVLVSMPTFGASVDFAKQVEVSISEIGAVKVIALNSTTIVDNVCPSMLGLGLGMKYLLGKEEVRNPKEDCSQCGCFCPESGCLAQEIGLNEAEKLIEVEDGPKSQDKVSEEKVEVAEEVANSSRKGTKDPPHRTQQSINEQQNSTAICFVCGILRSGHTPPGNFCRYRDAACYTCRGGGHVQTAHDVRSEYSQNEMRRRWGPDFIINFPYNPAKRQRR